MLRWVSNTYDPKLESSDPEKRAWLAGKFIGRPKASLVLSVAQLEALGMVGVYAEEGEDEPVRADRG